jgi:alpha-glucosidase
MPHSVPTPSTFSNGWRTVSFPQPPHALPAGVLFKNAGNVLTVTALTADIVRVRFSPTPDFKRDHSYVVLPPGASPDGVTITSVEGETIVTTETLRVTIHHAPFGLTFSDRDGRVIDEDDMSLGTSSAGSRVQTAKRLDDRTAVYGLGEKTGRLNKRGWCLGGSSVAQWATDALHYNAGTDPLYASVPFYVGLREGRAYGIYLDNTHRSFFDIGHQRHGALTFGAEGGELDYYFINGPAPADVLARYAQLSGRTPLPPRWSMGYHQCRWSYYPESRVRKLAADFREKKVPGEVIWLDVHHLDGYAPFTWDHERFPDPKKLLADLRADGFRVVPIVDPHIKVERGHPPYDSGIAGGHFVKTPADKIYEAPVWPSNAGKNPRPSVFPDFTRPATRRWWGSLFAELLDLGAAGIWNDMNEPTVFVPPTKTFPLDLVHDNEGEPASHAALHNVYGMLNSRATHEGLRRLRPDTRPFVLTRATFAGGQRYSALWTGDNASDWAHLQLSIPMLLGLGLSGFTFVGADIGGFSGIASAQLFTRWLQAGIFYPFMRAHTEINTPDQEPWAYGAAHETLNRRAIELRYELLPHLYNVMADSCAAGHPAMRPLFFDFPHDDASTDIDDVFLFGRDLLVAPVLTLDATFRETYLPPGDWYDFWTGQRLPGGKTHYFQVTLESIPLFIRAGGFVFRQPVVQHTGEMPGQPLIVCAYPDPQRETSSATFYEDDGETLAHERGIYRRRTFTQHRDGTGLTLECNAAEGSYQPAPRTLILRLFAPDFSPQSVTLDGRPLGPVSGDTQKIDTWCRTLDGFIDIHMTDRNDPIRVIVN